MNLISDENKELMKFRVDQRNRLYQFTTAFQTRPKNFKNHLKTELESIHESAESIYETVQDLNELRWMKLKKRK